MLRCAEKERQNSGFTVTICWTTGAMLFTCITSQGAHKTNVIIVFIVFLEDDPSSVFFYSFLFPIIILQLLLLSLHTVSYCFHSLNVFSQHLVSE